MDIVGKYLDSVDKWESFYAIYAKWMGFGKRSDDVKRRNGVVSMRREEKLETDAEGALGFLDCLSDARSKFYMYHQADTENRLANVFWVDGAARIEYQAFGDVIAFDTTYMTNKYNKPLCILMGFNHHFSTCVFGFALLVIEKNGDLFMDAKSILRMSP
ncbi:protein FAR1-RELATED SEQUENCE 3-like [Humulus lupulus]|uniref:protein FAR1-RELATED SEQUENCE 3-like n=1 Tax=Humulus lupulus TaxID=3486 RepID=UPI002B40C9A0|nr:protein FAR1-RELATED SEQUENCE 3-like [Humulus lupulus]